MGVRYLNTLIKRLAPGGLKSVQLSDFSGKCIVIDTSIYLHKFLAANSLIESMYFMIAQFKYFNILPIFVFDGAAPAEKQCVLNTRECVRENARQKYNQLSEVLSTELEVQSSPSSNAPGYETDVNRVQQQMRSLKRRFIRIHGSELSEIKRLMREFDVPYVESDGESDVLCAYLVKTNLAQACMSDDMDMFMYGCPIVLRHVNIWHGTGVQYTLSTILEEMRVSLHSFRMVCILSGTDYNTLCERDPDPGVDADADDDAIADADTDAIADAIADAGPNPDNSEQLQVCRPIKFRFYLSTLITIIREYYDCEFEKWTERKAFDVKFYNSIIETHKKYVSVSSKSVYVTQMMFQRAYSIFSSDPSDEMKDRIQMIPRNTHADADTTSRSITYEIPHKVKRMMAKYNFIYI